MRVIEATRTTSAPATRVWTLLADAPAWAQWGAWNEVFVEGGGEHERGAIRVVVRRPLRVRERVTEWVPGERMSYELVDGMKVQGYRSTVTLEGQPDGTTVIRWRSEYEKAGPLTAIILRGAVRDACRRLAKAADGLTPGHAPSAGRRPCVHRRGSPFVGPARRGPRMHERRASEGPEHRA